MIAVMHKPVARIITIADTAAAERTACVNRLLQRIEYEGVAGRTQRRSKYGAKRPKEVKK